VAKLLEPASVTGIADRMVKRALEIGRNSLIEVIQTVNRLIATPVWVEVKDFKNGWVNYDVTTITPAAWYQDLTGRVWLKGLIKDGTLNAQAFILPLGMRPKLDHNFTLGGYNGAAYAAQQIVIKSNGGIYPQLGGAGSWVALNGISFLPNV
jgi:hypothetical protein